MEYIGYEINITLFKGIIFGVMEETFIEKEVIEKDFVIYLGMINICYTRIYNLI
jgi:Ca2+/Na+ antiporter